MKEVLINKEYLSDDSAISSLSDSDIEELIAKLNDCEYSDLSTKHGFFCYCPTCKKLRITDRCACMCGSCKTCGYRWCCMPTPDFLSPSMAIKMSEFNIPSDFIYLS